jgi:hypothetical protein
VEPKQIFSTAGGCWIRYRFQCDLTELVIGEESGNQGSSHGGYNWGVSSQEINRLLSGANSTAGPLAGKALPGIRVIWHGDLGRTLFDYMQESGRAGRDGLRREATMIVG